MQTHKLALGISHGCMVIAKTFDRHAEPRGLKLARIYRRHGIPGGEAAVDIRAARDGIEMEILLDFLVDVEETVP